MELRKTDSGDLSPLRVHLSGAVHRSFRSSPRFIPPRPVSPLPSDQRQRILRRCIFKTRFAVDSPRLDGSEATSKLDSATLCCSSLFEKRERVAPAKPVYRGISGQPNPD